MNFTLFLLLMQNQIRIYHWQTKSFAEHKAFDGAYEAIGDLADRFMEAHMGRYGRKEEATPLPLTNYTDGNYADMIDKFISVLENEFPKHLNELDTDLLNIRDEILGELNKLKYLLTLK